MTTSNTGEDPSTGAGTPPRKQIRNRDMLALRNFITGRDDRPYDLHESTLLVDLTHSNLMQRHIEIRFDRHDTVEHLKQKIHQKTGTPPHFQNLQFKICGETIHQLENDACDHYKLGYFLGGSNDHTSSMSSVYAYEVHCVDINPHSGSAGGQYEDVTLVEKYRMTETEYDQRQGTLRDWGRQQKARDSTFSLAKHAREHQQLVEAKRQHKLGLPLPDGFVLDSTGEVIRDEPDVVLVGAGQDDDQSAEDAAVAAEYDETTVGHAKIIGKRCQVDPGKRRGVVSYVGVVPELGPGFWIGVTFDEPVGKTDGSVATPNEKTGGAGGSSNGNSATKMKRYFEAMPRYASFVRGKNVEVGDFPERDLLDSSDEEEL